MRYLSALLFALLLSPSPASAQEATPAPFPLTPDPSECQATPRTVAEIDAFAMLQQATPSPETEARRHVLKGPTEPATAEEVAGITATAREYVACLSLNDAGRAFGLFTDDLLAGHLITSDQITDPLPPLPDGELTALLDVIEPRTFLDGRVGAIVLLDDPRVPSPVEPIIMVFVEHDGRWLIDDLPMFAPSASDTSGTPVPAADNRAAWGLIDPDPAGCQIAPRDADELAAMEGTPPIGPTAPMHSVTPPPAWPESVPADDATVAGIEATVNELAACGAAGEYLRTASLFTDELISSPYFSIDSPSNEDNPSAIAVYDVRDFGDGRVGAVIGFESSPIATPVYPIFWIFERVGDRWLVADWPDTAIIDDGGEEVMVATATAIAIEVEPTPTPAP